jgi:hypothetical protein
MSDSLAAIKEIIAEHQSVRSNIKLIGDSVSDQEALNSLKSARSDWAPGQLELLAEKRKKLGQTVSSLDEGLKNHFTKEETVLPSFLGDFLMQALLLEHGEIKKAISEAKLAASGSSPENPSQAELASLDAQLQRVVGSLSRLIESHADKEDMMLEMVQRTLD